MKKTTILVISLLFCLTLCGCIKVNDVDKNKHVKIGLYVDCLGFYPWIESYDTETLCVNANIFNSLVEFDKDFRIVPALALSWNNPDNVTWRFFLRKDVKFHNGYNFTAEDVKYTIDLIKGDENNLLRDIIFHISEVKVIDNFTVDIITYKPYPILLNRLVDIFIISKKYQEETETKWPIGTGGYKLVEHIENDYILLDIFKNYWNEDLDIDKVTFKILQGIEERKNALISKDVDIIMVNPDNFEELSSVNGIELKMVPSPSVIFLGFDFRVNDSYGFKGEKNPVSDVNVRKAIYHAINISNIIERCRGGIDLPASQFVTLQVFGFNPEINRLNYDVEKAKELMIDAGYEKGFEIRLDCINSESQIRTCEEIADQLSKIDIHVELNPHTVQNISKIFADRNTSFYYLGWIVSSGDGGEIFDCLLKTVDEENGTGNFNFGYYSNPDVDEIGDKVSNSLNPTVRLMFMQQGFKIAMDDVAFIPLFISQEIHGSWDYINWTPRADGYYKVEDIRFN